MTARGGGNGSLVGPGGPFGCAVASVSSPPSFPSSVAAVVNSTIHDLCIDIHMFLFTYDSIMLCVVLFCHCDKKKS